jgi:hypothetical protein
VTQRLTPLAWVFIGILGLALVVGCTACTLALVDGPTDEPWDPTATATPAPTGTPMASAGPSPTPTVWYQDIVTPTVAATETVTSSGELPWWSDQMTENEDGDLIPPQEVQDAVWEAFIAGLGCFNIPDRETIPDASLDELTQQALLHLDNDPMVLGGVCNGLETEEELSNRMERLPIIRLVEFGPRNQVACESPTRCATAVSVEAQGAIWWHEPTCTDRGYDTPCILRLAEGEMADQAPNQFFYAELQYDQRSERWEIAYVEVTDT